MAVFNEVLAHEEKPEIGVYVPCIDYAGNYRIAKWDGKGWISRDINSTESPPYRDIMSWLKSYKNIHSLKNKSK